MPSGGLVGDRDGLPSDVRAIISAGSDWSVLLVGAAGQDGGGLWRARIG